LHLLKAQQDAPPEAQKIRAPVSFRKLGIEIMKKLILLFLASVCFCSPNLLAKSNGFELSEAGKKVYAHLKSVDRFIVGGLGEAPGKLAYHSENEAALLVLLDEKDSDASDGVHWVKVASADFGRIKIIDRSPRWFAAGGWVVAIGPEKTESGELYLSPFGGFRFFFHSW
jgi:hypothetical protein